MTRCTFPGLLVSCLLGVILRPGAVSSAPTRGASTPTSCNTRSNALRAYDRRPLPFSAADIDDLQKALNDPCPPVQAQALFVLQRIGTTNPRHGLDLSRIRKLASQSPFFYVRCAALLALGHLRDRQAEPLMASALYLGVSLELIGEGGSHHLAPGTLPQCAVWALMHLHGQSTSTEGDRLRQLDDALRQRLKNETRLEEQKKLLRELFRSTIRMFAHQAPRPSLGDIQQWREKLRARGLGTRAEAARCLGSYDCQVGQACVNLLCVPVSLAFRLNSQILKARGPAGRPHYTAWRNADEPEAVKTGLGMGTVPYLERLWPRGTPPESVDLIEGELTNRVRHLWLSGRCVEAIPLALRAYRMSRSSFIRSVLGMCACQTGNLALARWSRDRSPPSLKPVLVQMCRNKGLTLGKPRGGAATDPPPP